jgi:hypothetical protein
MIKFILLLTVILGSSTSALAQDLDTLHDDIASFYAGKPALKYFKNIQSTPAYGVWKSQNDAAIQQLFKEKIGPIRKWSLRQKLDEKLGAQTLFYPFSGADVLYGMAFVATSPRMVLMGLEPAGKLKGFAIQKAEAAISPLNQILASVSTLNRLGFFVTRDMEKDFRKNGLNGTIHLAAYYLKTYGYQISQVEYLNLNEKGELAQANSSVKNRAWRITFFAPNSPQNKRTIEYLSCDLSNDGLKKNPALKKYVQSLEQASVYMKAASYLLVEPYFTDFKSMILSQSQWLLQDDTGLPYNDLKSAQWEIEVFGTYSKMRDQFKWAWQDQLFKAIKKANRPLPFQIGYNAQHNETQLILAHRK